jgi:hypothetical protein
VDSGSATSVTTPFHNRRRFRPVSDSSEATRQAKYPYSAFARIFSLLLLSGTESLTLTRLAIDVLSDPTEVRDWRFLPKSKWLLETETLMHVLSTSKKLCGGLGMIAFLALASGLSAETLYTYTYSGPGFTDFDNNSTELAPIVSGNVDISLTFDVPILSDGLLTDYTADITTFAVSDGQELLDPANATIDAFFGTTDGAITDWTITATAHGLGPNEDYYQIDSETNTGILNPNLAPFYSDIALNVDDSTNFSQGKANGTLNASTFQSSAPEPSTEAMVLLGVLPFLILAIARKTRRVQRLKPISGRRAISA